MRGGLLLVLSCTVACVDEDGFNPPDPGGAYPGPGGGPSRCDADSSCPSSEVCARNGICYPPAAVRSASVTWTLQGQAAGATTCSPAPSLEIGFYDATDLTYNYGQVAFAPVPCVEGKFSIDKLPKLLDVVTLGNRDVGSEGGTLDDSGLVTIDLPF